MKRSGLSYLFITLSIGLLAVGAAEAATMVPITACTDCHGTNPQANQAPIEGTERNNPPRAIIGSHTYHVNNQVMICADCHVVPTTLNHRNGRIEMAASMSGGVTYSAAAGGSVPQDNQTTTAGMGTCSGTSCHSSGSPTFGTSSTCRTCHGFPPVTTSADVDNKHATGANPVNHIGVGTSVDTKAEFVTVHGGCQLCHGTDSTTDGDGNTHNPYATYDVATMHAKGSIHMNGPVGTGTGYDPAIRGCTAACHASTAPYRMTASNMTVAYFPGQDPGNCVSCHTTAQPSPIAQALNASVTSRAAVVGEFGLAWGHKKSGRGAVTAADCIVCHLEGSYATQSTSAKHKDGYIDLRDPDGAGETAITNNSGGAFTFTKYAISYAAGSRTTTLGNTVPEVITVKFCMKCHDSNGAQNPTARAGAGSTNAMPFGGVALGATYIANNNAIGTQGLIDVATQFAATNSSRHPVGAPNSRAYPYSTRLAAPYNNIGTTRNSNTQTINTASPRVKANSVIMVCDDCHTTGTTLTTRTITAHGSATGVRGTFFVSGPTLCLACHIAGTNGAYNNTATTSPGGSHGAGSAFGPGTTRPAAALNYCNYCHFSNPNTYAAASRPRFAQDVHGFNVIYGTTAGWTAGNGSGIRPIAFMRNSSWPSGFSPRPYVGTTTGPAQATLAAGNSTCGGSFAFAGGNSGISCSSNGHTTYTPGGSY